MKDKMTEQMEKMFGKDCKNCGSYEEKESLTQEEGIKEVKKIDYCKKFKQKLKDRKPCDKFQLSMGVIRDLGT